MKRQLLISLLALLLASCFAFHAEARKVEGGSLGFVSYVDRDGDGTLELDEGPADPMEAACVDKAGELCIECPEGADPANTDEEGNILVDACQPETKCIDKAGEMCLACPSWADPADVDESGNIMVESCEEPVQCIDVEGELCAECPEGADMSVMDDEGNVVVESCFFPDENEGTGLPNGSSFIDAGDGCSLLPGGSASTLPAVMSLIAVAAIFLRRRRM